ncbi:MAG: ACT domain-containing protein [Clostridia bacterium]|nr:ACT domain-containing protein [Clostridia bacterium]
MAIKQLSVFVENKEGALVEVTETLAKNQIDLKALSIADTQDYGILRVIVNDIDKAKQALEENGNIVKATDVVGFAVTDETGSMSKVISILSQNGINIEYLYAFISVLRKNAYVVARVKDNDKAEKILIENGIKLITEDDIKSM